MQKGRKESAEDGEEGVLKYMKYWIESSTPHLTTAMLESKEHWDKIDILISDITRYKESEETEKDGPDHCPVGPVPDWNAKHLYS